MKVRLCELCREEAAVFCPADAAFLCCRCDAGVHGANFLVARHVRQPLRAACHEPAVSLVADEDGDSAVDSPSSSSSACNSSTTTKDKGTTAASCSNSTSVCVQWQKSRRTSSDYGGSSNNAEAVFVDWCRRLGGLAGGRDPAAAVVRAASTALQVCKERLTILPLRVGLAAALWLGLRLGCGRRRWSLLQTWKVAKRLEEISGVPARLILTVGSKLERAARISGGRHKRRRDLEEGWAESS